MGSKSVQVFCVVLRFLTLGALVASIVVLTTNQIKFDDGSKISFKDVITYRFVVATACVGCLYTLIQIPFAIYYANKGKRLLKTDFLPNFDFYGDKIVAFLLACGVGAGFSVTFELKKLTKSLLEDLNNAEVNEVERKTFKFLDKAYIGTGLLLLGFLCVALLSVFSSINRTTSSRGFFG